MGSISLFDNGYRVSFALLSLLFLFVSGVYASYKTKLGGGIWLLFWGLVLEFITSAISFHSVEVYARGGAVEGWIFAELLLNLASMLLLAMAASQILVNSIPDLPVILGFGILGLVAVFYFLFVAPDGEMVSSMR